ncbi:MAG TPA: hypothetical protein VGN63_10500 [Flavisolibacter sp.]|jgi:hypothetical protein|nr:hypothetical protein [Flavisolibacter sp.]
MSKKFLVFACIFLLVQSAIAQKLDSLFEIQWKADPQEKVSVHFDKSHYNPGETIWFKAYLFTGNQPSVDSKNFYAELVDEQGNVLQQKTAPIAFASANSHFDIDSNFTKTAVFFRGYTVSMLNSDTSFMYTKPIRIIQSKMAVGKTPAAQAPPTLRFLPEGGNWIVNLPSNLAFIATDDQELPVDITGTINDNTGAKVASFSSIHNGMGTIELTPQEGRTYTATWKTENGKSYTTALPVALKEGISLKIQNQGTNKRFFIHRSANIGEAAHQVHIVAYMNQQLMFKADADMSTKTSITGVFPTQVLPSGILQITVFDQNYKPLAERISFVNNRSFEFDGDAFFSQKNFERRGLNRVEVIISDTVPANLSLAIVDADLNERPFMSDNIVSRFLLTGDLRGKIVRPYYYFYSNNDSAAIHLDLVMLTHGWRRYNWEAFFAGKTTPPRWKESNYLSIEGKIAGLPPGSYRQGLELTGVLQAADSSRMILSLPVDRNGNVSTDGLIFFDQAKLFFNFNTKSLAFDKSMLLVNNGLYKSYRNVRLDSLLRKSLPPVPEEMVAGNNSVRSKLLAASRQMASKGVLENITITARTKTAKEKMEEKYVSGLFSGDGYSFDLVNDPLSTTYQSIFQYLQGRVAGLQITGGGATPSLMWRGGTPVLYLNEMRADPSLIASTPVSDIAYIKILRPGSSIVSGGGGGVISIYTRKGGDSQPDPNTKGLSFVQMTGYSPVKEFYSPDYATYSPRDAYDDVRSTLYWNPSIYLDKNRRRMRLQFYNNDITKRFLLVMEGINAEGKVIHVEKEISNW